MKKLYIINHGDVRRQRATNDEIAEFIAGDRSSWESLATVELDDDGNIIATPLTAAQLGDLGRQLEQQQRADLIRLLDGALSIVRIGDGMGRGVNVSEPITIWPEYAPFAEDVVREWASERGLHVHDEAPPADTKKRTWIRTATITIGESEYSGRIVRMQWPAVEIGTEQAAVEVMCHAISKFGVEAL